MGIQSLCVYCGASAGQQPAYPDAARQLGAGLAHRGIRLIFGGGRIGMMGLLADAALEAGGEVVGVIPEFLHDREVAHQGVTELVMVRDMHERKRRMFEMSDAFASLPGGLGTLEETFEMLTWRQIGLHAKPIYLIDIDGYWQPLVDLIDHIVRRGFAKPSARKLVRVVADVDELVREL